MYSNNIKIQRFKNTFKKEVKQLLSGMLKVKEDERMSWEDVFNHPLAKESP